MTHHPITPPPQLRQLWAQQAQRMDPHDPVAWQEHIATKAARWGADQEMEACCAAMHTVYGKGKADWLRSARRPKPPTLKERALDAYDKVVNKGWCQEIDRELEFIRSALEKLPNE